MKVLLVEDDRHTVTLLSAVLGAHHYTVDVAEDGQIGLDFAASWNYDLIVLDLLIPKLDGISLCRQIRCQGDRTPILVLTAKASNEDIVKGLDAGADDYVTKPYNLQELMARIRALLRRRESAIAQPVLTWEKLRLNFASAEVSYAQRPLSLTPKEYRLLEFFLRHPQRVFSRSTIIDHLWSIDDSPSTGAVTNLIKDLRQKLKAAGMITDIIETVYGLGYRLKAPPKIEEGNQEDREDKEDGATSLFPERQRGLVSVSQVIERFRETFAEQIMVLKQVEQALLTGHLSEQLRQNAKQESHKLAGGLGTFGYAEGSRLAGEIEHLLTNRLVWEQTQIAKLMQLIANLEQELAKPPILPTTEPILPTQTRRVLVVDDDVVLTERLKKEGATWGMQLEAAPDLTTARQQIAQAPPDVILLDLTFPDGAEDGLTLLRELTEQSSSIPVLVFTGRDSLADRIAVSRLGGRGFLHKPVSTEQVFEAIAQVLSPTRIADGKVMIVDHNPVMLETLSNLFRPWGLQVTKLKDTQQFW
ncbi:MAG: response regulator, partial [Microcystaceae cyanobacterium]